jgi:exopolysaccharide production protein ExoZ
MLTWVQALRGAAALLVVFFHSTGAFLVFSGEPFFRGFFHFGYAGVDVFFVLSGFIITYSIFKDSKPVMIKKFLIKRFIRIAPVYWLLTLLIYPLYLFVPSLNGYQSDPVVLLKSFLFFPQEQNPVLAIGWTLNHEMKFYLLFGILLFIKPLWSRIIVSIILIGSIFSLFYQTHNIYFDFFFAQYNLEFLFGFIAAKIFVSERKVNYKYLILISVPMFLIFGMLDNLYALIDYRVVIYGIPSALLITGLAVFETKTGKSVRGVFLLLGSASYSIYLTHSNILSALSRLLPHFKNSTLAIWLIEALILSAIIIVGLIFYKMIEKPIVKNLNKAFL